MMPVNIVEAKVKNFECLFSKISFLTIFSGGILVV